jgi:hypothetical protein
MHAVIGGCLDPAVKKAKPADQARVGPELVKELDDSRQQENADGNTAKCHRNVKNPIGERAGPRLAQRRREIEFLALMMHGVGGPKQTYGVAQAVLPVIAEVVKQQRKDPGDPAARGEVERSGVQQQPLIDEKTQEPEKHAHSRADNAATQVVDGIGEVVVLSSPGAVYDELHNDGRYEDRNRESHSAAVSGIHVGPGKYDNAENPSGSRKAGEIRTRSADGLLF